MKLSFGAVLFRERPSTLVRGPLDAASSTRVATSAPASGTGGPVPAPAPEPGPVRKLDEGVDGEIPVLTPVTGPKLGPV
jgi:hypothetical protein